MDDIENNPEDAAQSLSMALLQYYDDFTDFNEDCAFLCDAFASLAANSENMDQYSIRGLQRSAYWLKRRVAELKENLKQIRALHSPTSV